MREFQFENQGANTYLIYQFAENEGIDTMSLGMLTNIIFLGWHQQCIISWMK